MTRKPKTTAAVMAAALSLAVALPAAADPPPWAPAHGWRAKQNGQVARAPAAPVILMPTNDAAYMTCDRTMLSENATLIGQILGGATGALAGSQFGQGSGNLAATAGGALIGVLLGGEIASSIAPADAACAQYALESARNGQTVAWNASGGHQDFQITPQRTFNATGADYCREYTSQAIVGGRTTTMDGTACRQPDGQWKIIN
ncbi:MAG: glycine zipper 2TM domain-containing protein [Thalassobaculaceae bacterium]|nr:glycine zipper 2TM domain-containing protein [Thalassobaculaceae bacterium]